MLSWSKKVQRENWKILIGQHGVICCYLDYPSSWYAGYLLKLVTNLCIGITWLVFHVRLKVVQTIMIPMISYIYKCCHVLKRLWRSLHPQCGSHYGRENKDDALLGWHEVIGEVQFQIYINIWWLEDSRKCNVF